MADKLETRCIKTVQKGFYLFEEGRLYEYTTEGVFIQAHGLGDYEVYTHNGRVSVFTANEFKEHFEKIWKVFKKKTLGFLISKCF